MCVIVDVFHAWLIKHVLEICVQQSAENSGSSTSSSGSGSNYGTIGRGGMASMSSMMDEMAKTLARRRKAAEKKEHPDAEQV
jgi:hypothetical protein